MRQSSSFVWEASAPLRRRECARALNESRFFVACAVAKPNHSNAKHIRTHALINERIVAERTEFPAFEAAAFCGGGRGRGGTQPVPLLKLQPPRCFVVLVAQLSPQPPSPMRSRKEPPFVFSRRSMYRARYIPHLSALYLRCVQLARPRRCFRLLAGSFLFFFFFFVVGFTLQFSLASCALTTEVLTHYSLFLSTASSFLVSP